MKRLTLPILVCLLFGAGSVVALEAEQDKQARPQSSLQALQASVKALQKQVAELKAESSRQAALISEQSDLIAQLKDSLSVPTYPANVFPTYTPRTLEPHQPLQEPVQQWWNRTEVEHPSAAIPNMPKGTQQSWINGMPFYFVPCASYVQTTFSRPAPVATKTASFIRNATAGALVLPGESDTQQSPVPAP